jgi:hypothetical protein
MIHVLEAVGVAWLMINVALFVAMKREDAMALSRRTIDRFWRAVGVCCEACRQLKRDEDSLNRFGIPKSGRF